MLKEPVVLTINRDEERALRFAEEVVERCPDVRVSKVIGFGPPELCHRRGSYVWPEKKIREFLNKRFNLEPRCEGLFLIHNFLTRSLLVGRVGDRKALQISPRLRGSKMSDNPAIPNRARMKVARLLFTGATALLDARDKLSLGEGQGRGRHSNFQIETVEAGLKYWQPYEANHGRESTAFMTTELGADYEKLLAEIKDLSERLQVFGIKMLEIEDVVSV